MDGVEQDNATHTTVSSPAFNWTWTGGGSFSHSQSKTVACEAHFLVRTRLEEVLPSRTGIVEAVERVSAVMLACTETCGNDGATISKVKCRA